MTSYESHHKRYLEDDMNTAIAYRGMPRPDNKIGRGALPNEEEVLEAAFAKSCESIRQGLEANFSRRAAAMAADRAAGRTIGANVNAALKRNKGGALHGCILPGAGWTRADIESALRRLEVELFSNDSFTATATPTTSWTNPTHD